MAEQIMNAVAIDSQSSRLNRIRQLNDQLRIRGSGGLVQMTDGIGALRADLVRRVFAAIAAFDDFNGDNDAWREHDCGSLTVDGVSVVWKIDYLDRSRRIHSADAADPKVTCRVLTVMRAEEY